MASEFDILALRLRADEWHDEAARAPAGPMREFCLREACQCERRLRASFETPVIREHGGRGLLADTKYDSGCGQAAAAQSQWPGSISPTP